MSDTAFEKINRRLEEFEEYIRQVFAVQSIPLERCSGFLLSQLARMPSYGGFNFPFQFVGREILHLEERGPSSTKPPKQLKDKALQGLWHKHFYVPGYEHMGVNAMLAWQLKDGRSAKLSALYNQIAKRYKGDNAHDVQGFARELANEMVYGLHGLEGRLKSKATGDWLVYMPFNGQNYYLCIAKHDEEAFIEQAAKQCHAEFPFLRSEANPLYPST